MARDKLCQGRQWLTRFQVENLQVRYDIQLCEAIFLQSVLSSRYLWIQLWQLRQVPDATLFSSFESIPFFLREHFGYSLKMVISFSN